MLGLRTTSTREGVRRFHAVCTCTGTPLILRSHPALQSSPEAGLSQILPVRSRDSPPFQPDKVPTKSSPEASLPQILPVRSGDSPPFQPDKVPANSSSEAGLSQANPHIFPCGEEGFVSSPLPPLFLPLSLPLTPSHHFSRSICPADAAPELRQLHNHSQHPWLKPPHQRRCPKPLLQLRV